MYDDFDQDAAHESALGRSPYSASGSLSRSVGSKGRLGFESVPSPMIGKRAGSYREHSSPLLNRATDSGSMPSPRLVGSPRIGRRNTPKIEPTGYSVVDDDQGINSAEPSPHGAGIHSFLGHKWREIAKNLLLQLTLITIFTAEVILRKFNTTLYMKNYRTALNFILVFACTIVFFVIIAYKKFVTKDLPAENSISRKLLLWYTAISVFDTVGMYMILLSATYITAPVSTLLSQGVIPVTIVLSIVVFKRRFHLVHYAGCLLLMGGIVLSVVYSDSEDDDENKSTSIGWAIVFFAANIPNAISSLLKEVIMSPPHLAEMNSVNAYVALLQCVLSIALAPASFRLQSPDMPLSDLPANSGHAFGCWITGNDYEVGDHCYGAMWAVWVHILLILALNIFALLVIFYGSAVMFWIAGACVIPLTAIVSSADFMGSLKVSFKWQDIFATVLTILGLIVYRLKPEGQAEEPPSDQAAEGADLAGHDGSAFEYGAHAQPILPVGSEQYDDDDERPTS